MYSFSQVNILYYNKLGYIILTNKVTFQDFYSTNYRLAWSDSFISSIVFNKPKIFKI